jgi:probable rRNA maturation factor
MIEILIKSDSRYPVNRAKLRQAVVEELERLKMRRRIEMSIFIVGARKMQMLNKDYRKIDKATNVLSFPLEDTPTTGPQFSSEGSNTPLLTIGEGPSYRGDLTAKIGFVYPDDGKLYLGDVVLCFPVIVKEAGEYQFFVDDWMAELAVHGLQHLLGKHHD